MPSAMTSPSNARRRVSAVKPVARTPSRPLHGKRILLGISGGVAAYKSALLARLLIKAGADVRVVLTDAPRAGRSQKFAAGAYFPLSGILAIEMMLHDGATVEVGVVGREGMFMQFDAVRATPANRLIVRRSGAALRVNLQRMFDLCVRDAAINRMLHRRWASSLSVMSQLVACNRHHRIEQQLSRWLLDYLDHDEICDVRITQERIAAALGISVEELFGRGAAPPLQRPPQRRHPQW